MSGIWDRVNRRGENFSPLPGGIITSMIYFVDRGVFTREQMYEALNKYLPIYGQLTPEESVDLDNILNVVSAKSQIEKPEYMLRLELIFVAIEVGMFTSEAKFRSELGVS
jgi:hypothetical protein